MKSNLMRAELLATGDELLNGRSVNTHARRLGEALGELGIELTRETTVRDDRAEIAAAFRDALARAPLVFVTGGLGPTCDDLTRDALSDALGRPIVMDTPSLERIRARYAVLGRSVNASREQQALVISGAEVFANSAGAAPGQRLDAPDGRTVFVLPGPPMEFEAILREHVLPWLRSRRPDARPRPRALFMVCGPGESDVVDRLAAAGFDPGPLNLAYCAAPGALEVRLTGAPGEEDALERAADRLRTALGHDVYAESRRDLAEVVGERLIGQSATLATAESCTGGGLGARITATPGASGWYLGGVIAYSNAVKVRELDVDELLLAAHGAVSEPVARAMADGARRRLGADYAIAITGIAGPAGGTYEKPVGLVWLALADAQDIIAVSRRFPGDREVVRQWSVQFALDLLRRRLAGRD
ncbi:MAG: CinA family nicotinamide mononucleotide deamidase-related protein [Kiritimatiellae bacterium]|nr:CinA family nicotinamide mononucleotide deamidase-related protein [Kiritimatiellia bacterium]